MRNAKLPKFQSDEEEEEFYNSVGGADWKESPHGVLQTVDNMLKEHGLEVLQYDSGGDQYLFTIVAQKVKNNTVD